MEHSTSPVAAPDRSRATPGALIVVVGGAAYVVTGPVALTAQIPVTTTTVPPPEPTTPPSGEPSGPSDYSGLVTILGIAAFIGAVVTILVKGKKPAVK